ncbi:hypothetical protein [Chryseobacterium sp. SL1]|uniref:hypothetical protein n=1 Tax=Chryseobacterium sp. SL1 TaxID=2995159 RepID=UPI00227355E7|nr:hypothetical protein [Chryseobacterium sp. SL1]MCY1660927.1 hypothetical protein [Chryseobacterium sp. SL1]
MSIEQESTLEQEHKMLENKPDSGKNKEQEQEKIIKGIKNLEKHSNEQEQMAELEDAASNIQKQIELRGDIDSDARKERGTIKVEQKNGYFNISSWGNTTTMRFIDGDTISVKGGSGHDLTIEINPVDGLEEVIKLINVINLVEKKSLGKVELSR